MTDRGIQIPVTATDQASPTFAKVGQNATKMGQTVTQAGTTAGRGLKQVGTDAKVAQQGLDQVEREAQQTGRSLGDLGKQAAVADVSLERVGTTGTKTGASWAAMGAATATALGALSEMSRQAAEAAVSQQRLQSSVEATGEGYDVYAARLDAAAAAGIRLAFDDEVTQDALSTLIQLTGSASEAMNLLALAQDLARGKGISLASASEIIGKVAQGNTAILSRYGIVLEEGATAQEALASIQQRYAGQAEDYANTTQASLDRVRIGLANFGEAIGESTGGLQTALALAPGVSAGYTLIGGAAGKAASGIRGVATAAKAGTLATSALAIATGPIGLVAAGLAGVAVLGSLTDWFGLAADGASAAEPEIQDLTDAIFGMTQAGADTGLVIQLDALAGQFQGTVDRMTASRQQAQAELEAAQGLVNQYGNNPLALAGASAEDQAAFINATQNIEGLQATVDGYTVSVDAAGQAQLALGALIERTDDPMINQSALLRDLEMRLAEYGRTGDAGALLFFLQDMITNFTEWYGVTGDATAAQSNFNDELQISARLINDNAEASERRGTAILGSISTIEGEAAAQAAYNDELIIASRLITDNGEESRRAGTARAGYTSTLVESTNATTENADETGRLAAITAFATAQTDRFKEAIASEVAALVTAQDAVVDFIADAENILPALLAAGRGISGEQGFIRDVLNLERSVNALGQSYDVLIGGTNAIGQQSQQLADWIGGLAVAVDGQSELNRLQAEGRLTTEQVSAAQAANNDILADNHDIQRDILAIQANQAPYLAELNAETAEYVENLRNQDDQQQRNVLTLMDANSQQQLAALYSAATAAATGQLGESGEQFVNDMAAGLKITNPLLYDMLLSTGAISETADGIEFNFDSEDAVSLVGVLGDLDSTLEDLIIVIDDLNGREIAPKVNKGVLDDIAKLRSGLLTPAASAGDGTGGGQPANLGVTANVDSSGLDGALAGLAQNIRDQIVDQEFTATITADTSGAEDGANAASRSLHEVVDPEWLATILGDANGAVDAGAEARATLNAVNGSTATVYIGGDRSPLDNALAGILGQTIGTTYVRIQGFGDIGFTQDMYRHGGIVGGYDDAAQHGLVTRGMRRVLTDEAGPEIKILPDRTAIIPAPMSSALMRGQGGKGDIVINGDIHVYESAGSVYDTFQALAYAGSR